MHARAALVGPLDRHDRHPVPPAAGEIDDLNVEDDARDPLVAEQVVGNLTAEALEATLGVLHGADGPDGGQRMEGATQEAPVPRLRPAHVAAIRLDPAAQHDIVILEHLVQDWDLVGRRREVRVGEDDRVRVGGEHPRAHGRSLAAMGDAEQLQGGPVGRGGPAALGPRSHKRRGAVRAPVVDHEDVDVGRQVPRAGRTLATAICAATQVPEQLVEGRLEAVLLVVRGQDDGQAARVHGASVYRL